MAWAFLGTPNEPVAVLIEVHVDPAKPVPSLESPAILVSASSS